MNTQELSMRDLLMPLCRRRRLFLGVLGAFVGAVLLGSLLLPRQYTAAATVLVEARREEVLQSSKDNPSVVRAAEVQIEDVLSEVELLKTRELFQQSVAKFDESPEQLVERLGLRARGIPAADAVAGYLLRHVEAEPVTNSNVIVVQYTAHDPELAARVVNAVMDAYVIYRRGLGGSGAVGLEAQQAQLRKELDKAEEELKQFDRRWGLVDPAKQKGELLSLQATLQAEASRVSARLDGKQREHEELAAHLEEYSPDIRKLDPVRTSEKILLLETEEADIERRLSELAQHYTDEHRETRELRDRLQDVQAAIRAETEEIVRSLVFALKAEIGALQKELSSYEARRARVDRDLDNIRSNEVTSQRMHLDLEIQQDQYTSVSKRLNQLVVEEAISREGGVEVVVASRAYPPQGPSFPPSLGLLLLASIVAGTFAGLSAVLVVDFADHTLSTPEETERVLGVEVLATINRSEEPLLAKPGTAPAR